ncbi:hypothetical protein [Siminovitchia fordii]|uniref:DUF5405 domain-containing protein n=1 Tax=Siminovitchia fordii TaxID=254759 RepID=A0ABQ4KA41_9BACI|nr:hypothetical protein [Siminovitchia fordii]GIN22589.1 hypothetical protein J1TS3_37230 [Siminovitchia fordii]
MKVHIEKNLYLESDGIGFSIREYTGKNFTKDGKEIPKVHGNYSTVKSAINHGLIKMKVMESTATTLKELAEDLERIEKFIVSKLNV